MRGRVYLLTVLLVALSACATPPAGEYNIRLDCDVARKVGLEVLRDLSKIGWCHVRGKPPALTRRSTFPFVIHVQVEPNDTWRIPTPRDAMPAMTPKTLATDPLRGQQWGLEDVKAPAAWSITRGKGIRVAVVDTGVDRDHPDLAGQIAACLSVIEGPCEDDHGHGTHVAGIIAMVLGNAHGGAGIAPEVKIVSIKVLNANGEGDTASVAQGILEAQRYGARVINLSLGGPRTSNVVNDAIRYVRERGVLVVAACGNDGQDYCTEPALQKDIVLSVSAVDEKHVPPWWANHRAEVVAPGVDILSSVLNAGYERWSGTSMAAPHVAGIAALVLAQQNRTPAEVEERIIWTTSAIEGCPTNYCGTGLVNAMGALTEQPRSTPTQSPYPAPTKEATATPSPRPFPGTPTHHAEPQPTFTLTPAPKPARCTVTVNRIPIWEGYHWVASINALMERSEAALFWVDRGTYALSIQADSSELCESWARLWLGEGYVVSVQRSR